MPTSDDFVRTQEDPLTFFRLRALHLAPQLGVPLDVVDEAIAIVYGALGREWLANAASARTDAAPLGFGKHPLGSMISVAGDVQVGECLELAEYLRRLANDPQLQAIIAGLKAQYYQTLLQLATAARLHIVGARNVELEPPGLDGRFSDIAFEYEDRHYRAECYRPIGSANVQVHHEMVRLAQGCLQVAKNRSTIYSIAIALSKNPTPAIRREARGLVSEMAAEIDVSIGNQPETFPALTTTTEWGTISVSRALSTPEHFGPRSLRPSTFPNQGNDFDLFMRVGAMKKKDAMGVAAPMPSSVGFSHIAVWLPPATRQAGSLDHDLEARFTKLGKKIESKLRQVRNEDRASRVLVVETWLTGRISKIPEDQVQRLRRKIVEAHGDVAGLLLLDREWMSGLRRHGYRMHALLPTQHAALPAHLIEALAAIDQRPDT